MMLNDDIVKAVKKVIAENDTAVNSTAQIASVDAPLHKPDDEEEDDEYEFGKHSTSSKTGIE